MDVIIGKKLGMTSIFDSRGQVVPVTAIEVQPMTVMQIKTAEKEGYTAVQFGLGDKKLQKAKKAELGHAKKAGVSPKKLLAEIKVTPEEAASLKPGQEIKLADIGFAAGDFVDVSGTSIGKGFAGVMKRHNFAGYPKSHGTHEYLRHAGSIGTNTTPGRVLKGLKMAGQMGTEKVTVMNLAVFEVRPDENLILIHGAVPGHKNGMVTLRFAKKKKRGQKVEAA